MSLYCNWNIEKVIMVSYQVSEPKRSLTIDILPTGLHIWLDCHGLLLLNCTAKTINTEPKVMSSTQHSWIIQHLCYTLIDQVLIFHLGYSKFSEGRQISCINHSNSNCKVFTQVHETADLYVSIILTLSAFTVL